MATKGGFMRTSNSSFRAYDELLLWLLEDADESVQKRALETLGHQGCVSEGDGRSPGYQATVDQAMERAPETENAATQYKRRAETAEQDAEWYRINLRERDAEVQRQKQRTAEAEDEAERWQNRVDRLRELLQEICEAS